MNDRLHFATLLHACHLGLMERKQLIAAADARIVEVEKPEDWLIELSTQGDSSELNQLVQREYGHVSFHALRLAYKAWAERKITDARFHLCCKELLCEGTAWYEDLLWVDDEFDLAESGIKNQREARKNIRVTMERILQELPRDWADSRELVELLTFTSAIYRDGLVMLFPEFPVPQRDEFKDWWRRRGPAVVVRPDGHKTRAVVEFQVGLLQIKGIRDLKNFRPEDGTCLIAMLPDVTSVEAPIGSQLLVLPELWHVILE